MEWFRTIRSFENGHKYFVDVRTGRISIADQSGATPDQTDDGVLYLDFSQPIGKADSWGSHVPLRTPNGEMVGTPCSAAEIRYLKDAFNW